MKPSDLIPVDYEQRLHEILNISWRIFRSQFLYERYVILKEAPFQHHFANIISGVGNFYCISREDRFIVDLETKCENIRGKTKFIDITCSFANTKVKCAIELKFKTSQQSAQDIGRIEAYRDIESLEYIIKAGYHFGKFYMITDSSVYINQSKRGVGTIFPMHQGFVSKSGVPLAFEANWKERVEIVLEQSYQFDWQQIEKWYFLDLTINPSSVLALQ